MTIQELVKLAEQRDLVGIFSNVKNEDYHAGPGYSKSGIDHVDQSPLHFISRKQEKTKALVEGSWFHTLMLEPHLVESDWVISPAGVNYGTVKYLEIQAANPGKQCVPTDVRERFLKMREACLANPFAAQAIETGFKEISAWWIDAETGLLCKARPDIYLQGARILVDLKTTSDASPKSFAKSCINYGYMKQGAFHTDGFNHATRQAAKRKFGTDPSDAVDSFVMIAVESCEPFGVAIYTLPSDAFEIGRRQYRKNLTAIQGCHDSGVWAGYPKEIQTLELPAYAYYD